MCFWISTKQQATTAETQLVPAPSQYQSWYVDFREDTGWQDTVWQDIQTVY